MHMHQEALASDNHPCACSALRKAARAVTRFYDEVMEDTGLSLAQFAVLRTIARNEPLPLMRLAHLLVMERTTLYRTLKPLDREGWVIIQDGQRRAKNVRLTAKGHKAVEDSAGAWRNAQARLVGRFGNERWNRVEASLQDLVAIAHEEMR